MRSFISAILLSCTFALVGFTGGCATPGSTTSVNEQLALGYSTVTAVRATATDLLNTNKISSADGQNVLDQTDNARKGLDIAREIAKVDTAAASGKITAVRSVLTAIQVYLATKGGK